MKKTIKIGALACAMALTVALAGCAGGETKANPSDGGAQEKPAQEQAEKKEPVAKEKDFDGSGLSDTGAGVMYLSTAGGTTEGGNVPQIVGGALVSIGINTDGMDGSVCTVYVDGMENTKMNAGERTQGSLVLEEDALTEGKHTVEMVKMDGDAPVIYKVAQYEVVE